MNCIEQVYRLDMYAVDPWHSNAFCEHVDGGSWAEWDQYRSFSFARATWSAWDGFQQGAAAVEKVVESPPRRLAGVRHVWEGRHGNADEEGGAHRCARYAETATPLPFIDAMVVAALWCCRNAVDL
jgi:hypothetical protein